MTDSAASSGPGPTGPNNDCSESESEERWSKSRRVIWSKRDKRVNQVSFVLPKNIDSFSVLCIKMRY